MWSKKKRLIIGLAGILVGLAAAGCGAADTPNQGVTPGPTLNFNDAPSGVEAPSDPTLQIAGRSTQQAHSQEEPAAAETVDTPTETPETALGSTREVEADFGQFRQLIPKDAIEPVYKPQFIAGRSAALDPEDLVIGVAINGESKAYPVGPLNFREMVNDVVGGVPILVSW